MLVFAHRGAHSHSPENTLEAFGCAIAMGVDGIETDVRVTRDGVAILMHDRTLGAQQVESLLHSDITRLAGHPVPTLAEALDAFPQIIWNLEVKTPAAYEPMAAVIRRSRCAQLLITSFWHPLALRSALELELESGILLADHPVDFGHLIAPLARVPKLRTVVFDFEIYDATLLLDAKRCGWRTLVYGAATGAEHEAVGRAGADGIITDNPALAGRNGRFSK